MLSKGGQAFPPHRRVRKKAEFELAFREKRTSDGWFVLNVRENGGNTSRLGITLSKRIMPKASARNYAKRLVREIFRRTLPFRCGLDVVVGVRRPITPPVSAEGRSALIQHFLALRRRCDVSSSG